jgi:hypothetical protein
LFVLRKKLCAGWTFSYTFLEFPPSCVLCTWFGICTDTGTGFVEFENAPIFHPFSSSVSDRECGDSTRVDATELRWGWGWGGSSEYVATAFDVWSPVYLASAARLYSEGSISTCHRDREKLVVL